MKKNISGADGAIRLLVAAIITILYFTHQIKGVAAIILVIAALIIAATAIINFCPLYYLLGISTKKNQHSHETRN